MKNGQAAQTPNSTCWPQPALALFTILVLVFAPGCASTPIGPAGKYKPEVAREIFRQQLATSVPVAKYGYVVKDLRFSADYQKALVVFSPTMPDRPDWEFVLTNDGFRRYQGSGIQPFYTPGTANTPMVMIRVLLPDR